MRVLLISADFPPVQSGEANHVFYLAQHLSRIGLDVHVLTSRIEGIPAERGLTVYPVMRSWSWFEFWRFVSVVRRCSPDAVLLVFLGAMYRHHPMITFAATVIRWLIPSVRFVTQFEQLGIHTWTAPVWTRFGRKLMSVWANAALGDYEYGTLLRDSHAIICLSEMHRTSLVQRHAAVKEKACLIPPPPLMKVRPLSQELRRQTRNRLGVNRNDFLLMFYGYVYRGKGFETLFAALRLLSRQGRKVRLLIVGGAVEHASIDTQGLATSASQDYLKDMKALAISCDIADQVIWSGPIPGNGGGASAYFQAADACVLPFDRGVQLNNSSFSAAAIHRLPIITTHGPTTESVFEDQHNVLLCRPESAPELAAAVELLMDHPTVRARLSDGVRSLADQWFSWERAVNSTIETLSH